MLEMQTSAGTIGRVVLPDSSVVMLNAGSVLRYPSFFSGGERRVELYGEAYLEVSKDSAHRFVVGLPDGAEIAVYGTKFNVDAYKDEPCIATLVEGSIGYLYRADDGVEQELRLKPNQRLRRDIAEGSLEITTTDCSCETAWKDGVILLNSTPLDEILRIVGRKYQVKFDVRRRGAHTRNSAHILADTLALQQHRRQHNFRNSNILKNINHICNEKSIFGSRCSNAFSPLRLL